MLTKLATMGAALLLLALATAASASPPTPADDPQRPAYHFVPPQGWMNDPSKPIEDLRSNAQHRFHLFFQWTPNSTKASWEGGWGPFWGHAIAQSVAGPWEMLCVPNATAPICAINIGKQGTGGAVQLNTTHFALTWPVTSQAVRRGLLVISRFF